MEIKQPKKMKRNPIKFYLYIQLVVSVSMMHPVLGQQRIHSEATQYLQSTLMLGGDWMTNDSHEIDFSQLPRIPAEHAVISDVRYAWGTKVHQHNYLVYFDGRFWAMWSDGPGVPREGLTAKQHRDVVPRHDRPGQLISYATSKDGVSWSE